MRNEESKPWFLCEKKSRLNCRITISTSWVIRNEVAIVVDTAAFFTLFLSLLCIFYSMRKKTAIALIQNPFSSGCMCKHIIASNEVIFFSLSSHYLFVCLFPSMYRQFLRASLLTIDFELRKILRTCKMNSNWIHQYYIGMNECMIWHRRLHNF